jgi:hypothetical protein
MYGREEGSLEDHTMPTSIWFHAAEQARNRQNEVEEKKWKLGPGGGAGWSS